MKIQKNTRFINVKSLRSQCEGGFNSFFLLLLLLYSQQHVPQLARRKSSTTLTQMNKKLNFFINGGGECVYGFSKTQIRNGEFAEIEVFKKRKKKNTNWKWHFFLSFFKFMSIGTRESALNPKKIVILTKCTKKRKRVKKEKPEAFGFFRIPLWERISGIFLLLFSQKWETP